MDNDKNPKLTVTVSAVGLSGGKGGASKDFAYVQEYVGSGGLGGAGGATGMCAPDPYGEIDHLTKELARAQKAFTKILHQLEITEKYALDEGVRGNCTAIPSATEFSLSHIRDEANAWLERNK